MAPDGPSRFLAVFRHGASDTAGVTLCQAVYLPEAFAVSPVFLQSSFLLPQPVGSLHPWPQCMGAQWILPAGWPRLQTRGPGPFSAHFRPRS